MGNFFSDLLGELTEEESAKRRENIEAFKKSLDKLAKKHGLMYSASMIGRGSIANCSNVDEEKYKELGFESLWDFGENTLLLGRRISRTGIDIVCLGIEAITCDRFKNPEEVKLPKEQYGDHVPGKPIYDDNGKQIGEYEQERTPNLSL